MRLLKFLFYLKSGEEPWSLRKCWRHLPPIFCARLEILTCKSSLTIHIYFTALASTAAIKFSSPNTFKHVWAWIEMSGPYRVRLEYEPEVLLRLRKYDRLLIIRYSVMQRTRLTDTPQTTYIVLWMSDNREYIIVWCTW